MERQADQGPNTSTKAVVSLILGIASVPAISCFGCGGIILGIAALIVGLRARREIADSGGAETGDGLALAGVIIGVIAAILGLLFGIGILVIPSVAAVGGGIQEFFEDMVRELGS